MRVAGVLFLAGAGLQAGAADLAMLICGRAVLGCGVGTAAGGDRGGTGAGLPILSLRLLSFFWGGEGG